MNIEARMRQIIEQHSRSLIVRSELNSLGSKSQVTYALGQLIAKGEVIRLAKGIFVKSTRVTINGLVRPKDDLNVVICEAAKTLGWIIQGEIPSVDYEDKKYKDIFVKVENKRVNRTFVINELKIHFNSSQKKAKARANLQRITPPSKGVADFVKELAAKFGVDYVDNSMDQWANDVTPLAGDEVKSDTTIDLLVTLKRAGKISKRDVAALTANHLRESY